MANRAVQRLNFNGPHLALRRIVTAVYAIAFLIVGFTHCVHHFNIAQAHPTLVIQADGNFSDDSGEANKKASLAVEHCHGCFMIAMAVLALPISPIWIASKAVVPSSDSMRSHPPIAESPPPISSI